VNSHGFEVTQGASPEDHRTVEPALERFSWDEGGGLNRVSNLNLATTALELASEGLCGLGELSGSTGIGKTIFALSIALGLENLGRKSLWLTRGRPHALIKSLGGLPSVAVREPRSFADLELDIMDFAPFVRTVFIDDQVQISDSQPESYTWWNFSIFERYAGRALVLAKNERLNQLFRLQDIAKSSDLSIWLVVNPWVNHLPEKSAFPRSKSNFPELTGLSEASFSFIPLNHPDIDQPGNRRFRVTAEKAPSSHTDIVGLSSDFEIVPPRGTLRLVDQESGVPN